MSLFDLGWSEVYFSMNYDDFLKKQNILKEANIEFKTKVQNNSIRLSMNNIDGRGVALSRGGPAINDYFKILVKKQDFDNVRYILNK